MSLFLRIFFPSMIKVLTTFGHPPTHCLATLNSTQPNLYALSTRPPHHLNIPQLQPLLPFHLQIPQLLPLPHLHPTLPRLQNLLHSRPQNHLHLLDRPELANHPATFRTTYAPLYPALPPRLLPPLLHHRLLVRSTPSVSMFLILFSLPLILLFYLNYLLLMIHLLIVTPSNTNTGVTLFLKNSMPLIQITLGL
jgi:hypothetical protein